LRAIYRASHYGKIKILLPMLASLGELDQALALIETAGGGSLRVEDIPFDSDNADRRHDRSPGRGAGRRMVRRKLDFLSLGTNDLIQYTLAIDRTDDAVAHLYDPLNPAVLSLDRPHPEGRPENGQAGLGLRRDGRRPASDPLLLGMGLTDFSMHPAHMLAVKQQVMRSHIGELVPQVRKAAARGAAGTHPGIAGANQQLTRFQLRFVEVVSLCLDILFRSYAA
jgi:phosphotransferase system enzyme I (PtsI)